MLEFVLGILSGVAAGMGLGGAALLVPSLMLLSGVKQLAAQTAGLYGFIPAAAVSTWTNWRARRLNGRYLFYIGTSGAVTAFLGARLAFLLSGIALRTIFGIFSVSVGAVLIVTGIKQKK
ncbi:MAG: TSUP family transporter [Bacillota bacterium]